MAKEYIEREALIKKMFPLGRYHGGDYSVNAKAVRYAIDTAPAADVVEISVLNEWLYEIAINNVGVAIEGDFSTACEEIIARLDGLRAFARERKERG